MVERDDVISLHKLGGRLSETIKRVNHTKQPVYVAIKGQPGVAIVDLDEYRELVRLAEKGLGGELAAEIERDEAAGALVPWEVVNEELKDKIERWKREEDA